LPKRADSPLPKSNDQAPLGAVSMRANPQSRVQIFGAVRRFIAAFFRPFFARAAAFLCGKLTCICGIRARPAATTFGPHPSSATVWVLAIATGRADNLSSVPSSLWGQGLLNAMTQLDMSEGPRSTLE